MRNVVLHLTTLLLALLLVACGDLPTGSPAVDLMTAGPLLSGECITSIDPGDPHGSAAQGCPDPGTGGTSPDPGPGPVGPGSGGTPPPDDLPPICPDYDPDCDESEKADDELADCADLGCQLRDPTPAEHKQIMDLIATLRTDGFCGEVRESAIRMVNRHVQVWDNRVIYPETGTPLYGAAPWDYARGGQVMYIWTGALTAWTIAHEAIHGIWNPSGLGHWYAHRDTTPLGLSLDATAGYCSGH